MLRSLLKNQTVLTCGTVAVLALSVVGCSKPTRAAVSGEVTIDGAPLDGASITFVPLSAKGPRSVGRIVNGKYDVPAEEGPPFGKLRVEILKDEENPPPVDDPTVAYKYNSKAPTKNPLPKIYNHESTLTVDVTEQGPNVFPFALESNSKPKTK